MYHVDLSQKARKFLDKLDTQISKRIEEKLKTLANNPVPSDAKFIDRDKEENKVFRYRIGDFRALYKIKNKEEIVLISKIDKRPRVYEKRKKRRKLMF